MENSKKVYNDHKKGQRCVGSENAHFFSMNYTNQFLKNYEGHNRFVYSHITAAHEDSGNVRTLDEDLMMFLKRTFEMFDNEDEDFVMFFISDHGRGVEKMQFTVKEYLEAMVPMTYIIMNKELEETLNSQKLLQHNTERLIGRYDINLPLKALSKVPYGGYHQSKYSDIKKKYPSIDTISLFHEPISNSRTCTDIEVPQNYCICKDYEKVDFEKKMKKLSWKS